jgi:hypothetical protein
MSNIELRNYIATFLTAFVTFLVVGAIYLWVASYADSAPVMIPLDKEFKITGCNKITLPTGKVRFVVKPGDPIEYEIHYQKNLDIPGDVTKQLIVKPLDGGVMEVFIPLSGVAGHLPVGEIKKRAFASLPLWTPEGTGRIKISSSHLVKGRPRYSIVETEEFEIRK